MCSLQTHGTQAAALGAMWLSEFERMPEGEGDHTRHRGELEAVVGVVKAYKERELKTSILLPEGEGGEGPQGLDVS